MFLPWVLSTASNSDIPKKRLREKAGKLRYQSKKRELRLILGDGVNQAADLASGATSIPSWNLTPWMTFGNWF
jgi:hypothetical protein